MLYVSIQVSSSMLGFLHTGDNFSANDITVYWLLKDVEKAKISTSYLYFSVSELQEKVA
jgi:hypothetical protein